MNIFRTTGIAEPKKIIIIAGPNGAGKTTFARIFLPQEANCLHFFNADLIAEGLAPFAPELAAAKAGRLMLTEINEAFQEGRSFAFETTLAGHGYLRRIRQWRAAGYRVSLFFLRLPSVDVAVSRVAKRVRQGGHNVPKDVIARRFTVGLSNFESHYKDCVDDWVLYDNGGSTPVLLKRGENI